MLLFLCSYKMSDIGSREWLLENQREELKGYFVYSCLHYAYGNETMVNEISGWMYMDYYISTYDYKVMDVIDELAKNFTNSIEAGILAKEENPDNPPKQYIYWILHEYKSKRLDSLVRTLDGYFIDEYVDNELIGDDLKEMYIKRLHNEEQGIYDIEYLK